ncbi:serine/threonine-protein kinase [Lentzea sp. BCCO 10_0856]|uniref:non-specific serine/threonine protein kinase n=1 Tax=Lentzea miocenica TaxID=3095431 RepID=A0ABU4TCF9_9PSEU|nr:serine/threonine-protein kinase [Lentzea sp. BCCO 10_0856]MDX8035866.1 serine/threonine-protein kinase [Lentzea sp. BCCO 10_0856]
MELLYRWCTDGIVIFSVKPPTSPDGPHGPLIDWRLTQPVLGFAQDADRTLASQRAGQHDEARKLAEQLSNLSAGLELSRVLIEITDSEYLSHAIASARALVTDIRAKAHGDDDLAQASWNIVRQLSRSNLKDYSLDRERMTGGQAYVYIACHKASGTLVAYKRLKIRDADSIARMRREIEAGSMFGHQTNVMPILDADPESCWFVMPLASSTARAKAAELREPKRLKELLVAVCDALRTPHEMGWIHRDLKPDNLLMLDNRWVVADWGLSRRPRGATSDPGRTRTGTGYGTEGYAAPELSLDAHRVGPEADIYSLGQIVGSILTGRSPQANIPLIPPFEPWAEVVSRATRYVPAERHQSVDEFMNHVDTASQTHNRST